MGGVIRRVRKAVQPILRIVAPPPPAPAPAPAPPAAPPADMEDFPIAEVDQPAPAPTPAPPPKIAPAPVVEEPDPANPADVVYSESGEEQTGRKRPKRRKKTPTILTGSQGVLGEAPTQKSTLLGS